MTAKPDKLEEIFRLQEQLNRRIGVDTLHLTEEQRQQWVLNYCRAMTQEIAELTDSVPWKWWAKYQKFDEQNARVEVVDLFHFLISMAQVLGMSADDVFNAYLKKNEVNFQRQESGYSEKIRIVTAEDRHLPPEAAEKFALENRRRLRICTDLIRHVRPDLSRDELDGTVHALFAMINSISLKSDPDTVSIRVREHLREMALSLIFSDDPLDASSE